MSDRYGSDVLNTDWRAPRRGRAVEIEADRGLVVEEVGTDWCGEIVAVERDLHTVTLEDRRGKRRTFPLGAGFLLEGVPVILMPPSRRGPATPSRTASGSVAIPGTKARVARASRIFVEGRHDAELVEKVWGDDLRVEGVVVEYLEGVDDLAEHLRDFRPGPERRVGVLVDHLVPGSKESRIAASIAKSPVGRHVLVVGHPFIDVWQAVKPARLGLDAWPVVPRGTEWKKGVCQALGWPHRDQADIARAWRHILGGVRSFADLEPSLLGRVEELIDFVTDPGLVYRRMSSAYRHHRKTRSTTPARDPRRHPPATTSSRPATSRPDTSSPATPQRGRCVPTRRSSGPSPLTSARCC